jgi:PAS domain S-box-containing protein
MADWHLPLEFFLLTGGILLGLLLFSVWQYHLRKKAERTQKETEARSASVRPIEERFRFFEKVLETMQIGITITDERGKILYTNPADAGMHGYQVEELIGKDVRVFAPKQLWKPMAREQLLDMKCWKRESLNKRKNDTLFPVQLKSVVVPDLGEYSLGVITVCEDISERKQKEREMATLEDQLRHSQKMETIGRLAGGMAHDFNNLLMVIQGYSDLALRELNDGNPLRENIEEIRKATGRAAGLIQQLLAFSRCQILDMKVLDLNSIVKDLEKMLRRVIKEDIDLVTTLAEDLGKVKTDASQIEQVILNLAANAREAMPQGGKLILETANVRLDDEDGLLHVGLKPGHYVMLSVTDTGTGMPPEVKERIFDPFFTTKDVGKGTGLGLSTVYGIVNQTGGSILVYSHPGKGTTFNVYLPRVEIPIELPLVNAVPTKRSQGSETILLVQDEEMLRMLARAALEKNGYHVLEASTGEEALQRVQDYSHDPIHLMVTDMLMPGMTGLKLAEHLAPLHPEMKVLYMSGHADIPTPDPSTLDPKIDFLPKPFSPDSLAYKVREMLDASSPEQAVL